MEITANLLRLNDDWIVAQVEELEGESFLPGDPDCMLKEPFVIQSDGSLKLWPPYCDDREIAVRSSDITTLVNPSKSILALYIKSME
jgi:hypothetical protein|tara:strand:+ start:3278 stop:3538 length:261 start_codon:yes stop_codon:yes gene_type:complete